MSSPSLQEFDQSSSVFQWGSDWEILSFFPHPEEGDLPTDHLKFQI
jgi:hypothetical protein